MRNLGVSLLFVLSLIAFFLTLEMTHPEQVRIEPSIARLEQAAERPMGGLLRNGNDGGFPPQGTITPLKVDLRKVELAYKLSLVIRPER